MRFLRLVQPQVPVARFRLRESLGALRFDASSSRPVYVRLETDTVLSVEQGLEQAGFVEVRYRDAILTVFCEDLVSKGDLLPEPSATRG